MKFTNTDWMTDSMIEGRRWFDGMNSYHTAHVTVVKDGAVVLDEVAPFQYGYGDCYMESALSLMVDRDLIDIARRLMRSPASTKNKTVVIQSVTDVKLRRDLHLGGKA
jgi:hypothetical protein